MLDNAELVSYRDNVDLKSYEDLRSDVDSVHLGYKYLKSCKVMVGFSRCRQR